MSLSDRFRVSPEIFERYLDGKKRVIKQGLSLGEAKQYQAIFNRVGALSEIDVVFDRRVLEVSTIFIKDGYSKKNILILNPYRQKTLLPPSLKPLLENGGESRTRFHIFCNHPASNLTSTVSHHPYFPVPGPCRRGSTAAPLKP